jgi:membrane-bound lytic murein transglycosylase D
MRKILTLLALSFFALSCSQFSSNKSTGFEEDEALVDVTEGAVDPLELEKAVQMQEVDAAEKTQDKEDLSPRILLAMKARQHADANKDTTRIGGSAPIDVTRPVEYKNKSYFLYGAEHLELENNYFDIPVVYNADVQRWISYFLGRGREFFERYGARAGRYGPLLGKILEDHGVPRDMIFLAMAESGFQNKARSWARAVGTWQFMPYTGKSYGLAIDWYVDERRDPIKATIAASKYLKKLYNDFGAWELAMAGYNAGEGKISRAIRRYKTENFWEIKKGRYLKPETKNYVPKIMALAIIGKNLSSFGFDHIDFWEPLDFEEVSVPALTDMIKLADALGMDFEDLHALNPELQRWFTPPTKETYTLRVPRGKAVVMDLLKRDEEKMQALAATQFQRYRVRGASASLADVAHVNGIKRKNANVLAHLNGLSARKSLSHGQELLLPFRVGQSRKDRMYADLYERPRKKVLAKRRYSKQIQKAKSRAKPISEPKEYYIVQKGDSLWSVSRKTGQSMDKIIVTNLNILNSRMIRPGDKLAVR